MRTHQGPIVAQRDGLRVIACAACGFAHLDPLPDPAALDRYYSSDFWATKGAGWLERYEAQRDWLAMQNGDWLTALESHVAGRFLLDVGCGYGFLLQQAKTRGWQTIGIEPSAEANYVATERLLTVHQGTWENFDHPSLTPWCFNAISAMWLLEHLPDPLAFLRWCRAHLHAGGALLLAVPQEFTTLQMQADTRVKVPGYWVHETHAAYFTDGTLSNLLGRAGFRVVDRLATAAMEAYLVAGRDYTADEALGAACHADVRGRELGLSREVRLDAARDRARLGVGRDLVVIAKADE